MAFDTSDLAAVLVAFVATVVFMLALRPLAKRIGLVDKPGGRKRHTGAVPVIGGLAMFGGFFIGLTWVWLPTQIYFNILGASALLLVVGVIDDRFEVPVSVRLASQVAAAFVLVYGAGLALSDIGRPFGDGLVSMGSYTLLFTTLVTVTMVNAYNFIDGLDGLAGSMALIAFASIAIVGVPNHPAEVVAMTAVAATAGYLVFNMPIHINRRIRCFMGDAGSTVLGFSVVWITLGVSQGDARVISPVHCLWFAAIPIFDVVNLFVRRIAKKRSPFSPGRDHFHHILLRGGFTGRQTLAVLGGLQLIYASAGIYGNFLGVPDVIMFWSWATLGVTQRVVLQQVGKRRRLVRIEAVRQDRVTAGSEA